MKKAYRLRVLEAPGIKVWEQGSETNMRLYFEGHEAPLRLTGEGRAEEMTFVVEPHRVRLYKGACLEDEEWPCGQRLWTEWVLQRDETWQEPPEEEKPEIRDILHFLPEDGKASIGDCMPFFDGARWHLYYLLDRRGHRSKWGLGAHQWAHISTTDLKIWRQEPMAIPITEEWEGSICTGSLLRRKGLLYAYYAARMSDGSPALLTCSVSEDGRYFRKTGKYTTLPAPFEPAIARDPCLFSTGDALTHMLVTTKNMNTGNGCLAHLFSRDMQNWEADKTPFLQWNGPEEPECSDLFPLNGRWYLVFGICAQARYRVSDGPLGPWRMPPRGDCLGPVGLCVPKTAPYGNERRLLAGFRRRAGQNYAGYVEIYEVFAQEDGTLSVALPKELCGEE